MLDSADWGRCKQQNEHPGKRVPCANDGLCAHWAKILAAGLEAVITKNQLADPALETPINDDPFGAIAGKRDTSVVSRPCLGGSQQLASDTATAVRRRHIQPFDIADALSGKTLDVDPDGKFYKGNDCRPFEHHQNLLRLVERAGEELSNFGAVGFRRLRPQIATHELPSWTIRNLNPTNDHFGFFFPGRLAGFS